jgi:hypothetical protein
LGFLAASLAAMSALVLFFWVVGRLPARTFQIALALLVISMGGLLLSISPWTIRLIQSLVEALRRRAAGRTWLGKPLAWCSKVLDAYGQYRSQGLSLAAFLLLSLLEQSAPVLGTWLAALALDINLGLLQAAAVAPLAMLCTRVPLSVAGFGVIEGFYMVFFPMVGVSVSDSFLLGLVSDLSVLVATLPGGAILALRGWKLEQG